MATYSFTDVSCTIAGPGGGFALGSSASPAEEGITITPVEKNSQQIGADGTVANVLHANDNGKVTVRLMKTSPANAQLSALFNFQKTSAANWGQNVIIVTNTASGDLYTLSGCAFTKQPDNQFGKDANVVEWEFDVARIVSLLGTY